MQYPDCTGFQGKCLTMEEVSYVKQGSRYILEWSSQYSQELEPLASRKVWFQLVNMTSPPLLPQYFQSGVIKQEIINQLFTSCFREGSRANPRQKKKMKWILVTVCTPFCLYAIFSCFPVILVLPLVFTPKSSLGYLMGTFWLLATLPHLLNIMPIISGSWPHLE